MKYKSTIDGLRQEIQSMEPKESGPLDLSPGARDDRIFELSAEFVAALPEEERTRFIDKVNSRRDKNE